MAGTPYSSDSFYPQNVMAAPASMPMQAPMAQPMSVAPLVAGAGQAQNLLQQAMQGGGASIADVLARVAFNQRMMQGAMGAPGGAVGYQTNPATAMQGPRRY